MNVVTALRADEDIGPYQFSVTNFATIPFHCHSSDAENSRNRSNLATGPVTVFRVRARAVYATINQTRVYPQHLATTDNAETRDLGFVSWGRRITHTSLTHARASQRYRLLQRIKGP